VLLYGVRRVSIVCCVSCHTVGRESEFIVLLDIKFIASPIVQCCIHEIENFIFVSAMPR